MTDIAHAPHHQPAQSPPPGAPPPAPFGPRLFIGVMGVLVAAIMSGLNGRVSGIALVDIRGALGFGVDDGRWISTVYTAGELVAMPFSAWFAVTYSFRRYHMGIVTTFLAVTILMPFVSSYTLLIALRAFQGLLAGALIPLLMTAALRFFPIQIRLYGLSLYSLTATFAPNLGFWLAACWTDQAVDLRFVYWQSIPLALFSLWAVWWGIPQDPLRLERLKALDWTGLLCGGAALAMIAIGLDQGERLDWMNSTFICWLLGCGFLLFVAFCISQWFHHLPFVKLQLLARRNLCIPFLLLLCTLIAVFSGSLLPADHLIHSQGFRPMQIAGIGLSIALPQIVMAPATAWLLYKKWVDARVLLALGLLLVAAASWLGSYITSDWMAGEFWTLQLMQAAGQALAIISTLFIATSVVAPMEGPFVSGMVNTLRAFGTLLGGTVIGSSLEHRVTAHFHAIVERLGRLGMTIADPEHTMHGLATEAFTLGVADLYRMLAVFTCAVIPLTLLLAKTHPPVIQRPSPESN